MALKTTRTDVLEVAYYEHGPQTGWPVVLSHGFPYDIHAYDEVVPHLTAAGARVIVPYLRGYGPTRFLSDSTMRTGQQAALGSDVIALLDALGIEKAILAGFDWGGLASCVATVLRPDRVAGLVSYAGYDIADRSRSQEPADPSLECVQWSPSRTWTDEIFDRTAASFDNPDFVDTVIHCYRFHMGSGTEGDAALEALEQTLASRPKIQVPAITLDGTQDPLKPGGTAGQDTMFTGRHERRTHDVGHAFPMEAPEAFAQAVLDVHEWSA